MRRLFYLLLLTTMSGLPSLAQPCTPFSIEPKKQRKILSRFIAECEASGDLKPKLGIIHLTEWIDQQGQLNWQVWAQSQWQQYAPIAPHYGRCTDCLAPVGWTRVSNRIVLRYQLNSRDTLLASQVDCLRHLLASSVTFIEPPAPSQSVPVRDINGQPILDRNKKPILINSSDIIVIGNGDGRNTHVVFKKDGSVSKGLSL